ncbi:FtsX-like permease family protein, partial [Gracilinema caldarium]|uniref:ABC transporter permease n=1 Tax=Gracilinema caldarium TaxID=215591 RepID=UPI0026EC6937
MNTHEGRTAWSTLATIAWRNVWRHGKRTALTVITMAFGLGLYIGMDSILKGMDRMGLENMMELSDSSVKITTRTYDEESQSLPLDYGIPDVGAVEALLKKDPRVLGTAPRLRFVGQLSNGKDSLPVQLIAIDPERDDQVFSLAKYRIGTALTVHGDEPVIMLGKKLAAELGLELGSWVTLSARTRYDSQNAQDFQVVALLDTPDPTINNGNGYISFSAAEPFLDLEGLRTELAVRMEKRINLKDAMKDSDEVAALVNANFPELSAKSFGEIGRQFLELSKAKSKGAGMIIFIMMIIAGVGIANTVLMSVYSRIREIGVLRAFGLTAKDIRRLFLLEGGLIGLVGSLAGLLFGIMLDAYFIFWGMPLDAMMGNIDMGLPVGGNLYGEWNPDQMVVAVIIGILIALYASRSPAKRAGKLEVTNA